MSKHPEEWRDVQGWEGYYQVSNFGRVRSVDRTYPSGWSFKGKVLKLFTDNIGRKTVGLRRPGEINTRYVHQLVAESFIGERPEGMEVCHNDGDPANNRVWNLRYGTRSDNNLDKRRHGTDRNLNKTRCPRGHRLVSPNLVASRERQGHRVCLSCARARAYVHRNPGLKAEMQSVSDRYYVEITAGEKK